MGKLRRTRRQETVVPVDNTRWVVLLTTSVRGDEERKELYIRQIRRWLNETALFIFVIESSGYAVPEIPPHDRLRVVSFDLPDVLASSSQYEAHSILHFLSATRNDPVLGQATHVLKVTGRYFLEGIGPELAESVSRQSSLTIQKNDLKSPVVGPKKIMFSDFPLFHTLLQRVKSPEELSAEELSVLHGKIAGIDEEGLTLIYVIIQYYSILEDKRDTELLPYKGKCNKNSVRFDISNFPPRLVAIIRDFVDLHLEKLQEEELRKS